MEGSPRTVSSRHCIKYRRSTWEVQEFEVWAGGSVCRAAALRAQGSLLLWVGARGDPPRLAELSLAVPAEPSVPPAPHAPRAAHATALLGGEGSAAPLARRLAVSLECPVYVSCGATFDRFTLPLVEYALLTELKKSAHTV